MGKGSVLRKLLKPGRHVIFADDSFRHLQAVNTALNGYAASVTSFHYTTATKAAKQKLDAASCDRAVASHVAALFADNNKAIVEFVNKRQAFLSSFILEQV